MPLIKRYSNRKLYDTEAKQYITLEGIAALIRDGVAVQVIDHETGDDLTPVIQSQIIFEQEKKLRGNKPRLGFNELLRAGNDTLSRLRHVIAAKDWQAEVDAEIERRMLLLIQAGEVDEEEGLRLLAQLVPPVEEKAAEPEKAEGGDLQRLLHQLDVPRRGDLQKLMAQVEALNAEVAALSQNATTPRKRTPKTTRSRSKTAA